MRRASVNKAILNTRFQIKRLYEELCSTFSALGVFSCANGEKETEKRRRILVRGNFIDVFLCDI